MSWKEHYSEIHIQYPKTVTVNQVMEIGSITRKTAYKYIHSGKINYNTEKGIILVELTSLLKYLYSLNCMEDGKEPLIKQLRIFYEGCLKDHPDILTVQMIVEFTGYVKTTIQGWINNKYLEAFKIQYKYIVPKKCLIDFMVNRYFRSIRVKSQLHMSLEEKFKEWK